MIHACTSKTDINTYMISSVSDVRPSYEITCAVIFFLQNGDSTE